MKKILIILLVLLVMTLSSCSHIEDTNGPNDFSVVTFTDEELLKGFNSYSAFGMMRNSTYINNVLNGSCSVAKLSGLYKIDSYRNNDAIINFNINFTCEEGNALLVIVSNEQIIKKIEANSEVEFNLDNNQDRYDLIVVGESAKLSLKYQVTSYNL